MPVHWHAQLGIHQEKGAEEVLDTVNHHIVRQGLLQRAGSIVLVFPPELATHLVNSGFTKADVGRYVIEGTIVLQVDGKPPITVKAGEVFFTERGQIHNARNIGTTVARAVDTYIIDKGKPGITPTP